MDRMSTSVRAPVEVNSAQPRYASHFSPPAPNPLSSPTSVPLAVSTVTSPVHSPELMAVTTGLTPLLQQDWPATRANPGFFQFHFVFSSPETADRPRLDRAASLTAATAPGKPPARLSPLPCLASRGHDQREGTGSPHHVCFAPGDLRGPAWQFAPGRRRGHGRQVQTQTSGPFTRSLTRMWPAAPPGNAGHIHTGLIE